MNSKTNRKIKAYFLLMNIIVSIVAFSYAINATTIDSIVTSGTGTTPPSTTTIPNGGPAGGGTNPGVKGTDKGISDSSGDSGIGPDNTGVGGGTGGDDTGGVDSGGDDDVDDGGDDGGGWGGGGGGIVDIFSGNFLRNMITKVGFLSGIGATIGGIVGGEEGQKYGLISGVVGGLVGGLLTNPLGEPWSTIVGVGVGVALFIALYRKTVYEPVEFLCLPWEPPIGGQDCQSCNDYEECSEYTCKSLGQACNIVNEGSEEQKCVWVNPGDVNSPRITIIEVNKEHLWKPDESLRPPATGVVISRKDNKCIKAFTPLEFTFATDEPAQCKIDYNLTKGFEEMSFFVGGSSLLVYNHTEKMSLPGPDALNESAPELKNDGEYTLFVRCRDANGNYNQDAYSVSFCVEKGPDTTPPVIMDVNIPSGSPVQYNQTGLYLEVYVNEPSECKWSREDRDYDNMEEQMICSSKVWEMNNQNTYTCKVNLTGIENRKENLYYFKCKDQPWKAEGDRNVNVQSYLYKVYGTQPLNIMDVKPEKGEVIAGSTDIIPVYLEIKTDNGYKDGEARCYYYNNENSAPESDEDYIDFIETGTNYHKQRQDLATGEYSYYFKCVDLGGNTAYNFTKFRIKTDKNAPAVVRVYRERELKIVTDEECECSYSNANCNFEIEDGIKMTDMEEVHTAPWDVNKNYYIRCRDVYNNQPNPNTCSIIVRPFDSENVKKTVIEL